MTIPRLADIKRAIATEYAVTPAMLSEPAPTGKRGVNTWTVSHPRQAAMALAFLLTEHSETRIGQFFGGRHPTTVRHAREVVAIRRRSDARLHEAMRRISIELVLR